MGIWPPLPSMPLMPIISSFGRCMGGVPLGATSSPAPGNSSNPFTQFGFVVPLYLSEPYVVDKVWWYNGTASSGSIEFAIYDEDMRQVMTTGSVTVSGSAVLQESNITNLTLDRGVWYVVINYNGTLVTYFMSNTASDRVGQYAVNSYYLGNVTPLPADLTGQFSGSTRQYPAFGISGRALIT